MSETAAITRITSPDDPGLIRLCARLAELADRSDQLRIWPAEQLSLCGMAGVHEWFVDRPMGGQGWSDADVTRGYLRLAEACLTTAFILTQRSGAVRRIAVGEQPQLAERLLPDLVAGRTFATVGISHLTTSRRHLARPVLRAEPTPSGWRLDGFSPWVTGALYAQTIVTGATLDDGRQVLVAVPCDLPGVEPQLPLELVGLSASATGEVRFQGVTLSDECLLAGPVENVMARGAAGTGGLQTSALACGLSSAACGYLEREADRRSDLSGIAAAFRDEQQILARDLIQAAGGEASCSAEELRTRANRLVLRATQAALTAAKGTGYLSGHPVGRWCREALFFLVWSCPQPVAAAHLCELAGWAE